MTPPRAGARQNLSEARLMLYKAPGLAERGAVRYGREATLVGRGVS